MPVWPLWALGIAVAVVFYLGLGYLLFAGVRIAIMFTRRVIQHAKLSQRSRDFGGEAFPTLLEVAAARVAPPPAPEPRRQPTRRAA